MDIGASQGGSLKLQETDNAGNPKGSCKNYQIPAFKTQAEFIANIKDLVVKFGKTQPPQFPASEKLEKILVFAPGLPTGKPGIFSAFSNLKLPNGQILKDIDFNELKRKLGSPRAQIITLGDVVGGLADAVSQMAKARPKHLFSGQKITFAVTGGGLGMVNGVINDNKELQITCSEAGTIIDELTGAPLEVSRTSVTALTDNFSKHLKEHSLLNLTPETQKKMTGKAVTDYAEARKVIPQLTPAQHQAASEAAVQNFIAGLVNAYHFRVNSGTKLAVLGGPVLGGIKDYLEKNPNPYQQEIREYDQRFPSQKGRPVMEKVFLQSLYNQLSDSQKTFFMRNSFDVITDIPVLNNTSGAKYVLQGKPGSHEYHYNIPLSVFKPKTD